MNEACSRRRGMDVVWYPPELPPSVGASTAGYTAAHPEEAASAPVAAVLVAWKARGATVLCDAPPPGARGVEDLAARFAEIDAVLISCPEALVRLPPLLHAAQRAGVAEADMPVMLATAPVVDAAYAVLEGATASDVPRLMHARNGTHGAAGSRSRGSLLDVRLHGDAADTRLDAVDHEPLAIVRADCSVAARGLLPARPYEDFTRWWEGDSALPKDSQGGSAVAVLKRLVRVVALGQRTAIGSAAAPVRVSGVSSGHCVGGVVWALNAGGERIVVVTAASALVHRHGRALDVPGIGHPAAIIVANVSSERCVAATAAGIRKPRKGEAQKSASGGAGNAGEAGSDARSGADSSGDTDSDTGDATGTDRDTSTPVPAAKRARNEPRTLVAVGAPSGGVSGRGTQSQEKSMSVEERERRARRRVTFSDLLKRGLIVAGEKLEARYHDISLLATIKKNGVVEYDGIEYSTPSAYSLQAVRKVNPDRRAIDGWHYCFYNGVLLSELRERARTQMFDDPLEPRRRRPQPRKPAAAVPARPSSSRRKRKKPLEPRHAEELLPVLQPRESVRRACDAVVAGLKRDAGVLLPISMSGQGLELVGHVFRALRTAAHDSASQGNVSRKPGAEGGSQAGASPPPNVPRILIVCPRASALRRGLELATEWFDSANIELAMMPFRADKGASRVVPPCELLRLLHSGFVSLVRPDEALRALRQQGRSASAAPSSTAEQTGAASTSCGLAERKCVVFAPDAFLMSQCARDMLRVWAPHASATIVLTEHPALVLPELRRLAPDARCSVVCSPVDLSLSTPQVSSLVSVLRPRLVVLPPHAAQLEGAAGIEIVALRAAEAVGVSAGLTEEPLRECVADGHDVRELLGGAGIVGGLAVARVEAVLSAGEVSQQQSSRVHLRPNSEPILGQRHRAAASVFGQINARHVVAALAGLDVESEVTSDGTSTVIKVPVLRASISLSTGRCHVVAPDADVRTLLRRVLDDVAVPVPLQPPHAPAVVASGEVVDVDVSLTS